ncbi:MAG: hypothetical protein RLO14_16215 [Marinobacter salarius]
MLPAHRLSNCQHHQGDKQSGQADRDKYELPGGDLAQQRQDGSLLRGCDIDDHATKDKGESCAHGDAQGVDGERTSTARRRKVIRNQ